MIPKSIKNLDRYKKKPMTADCDSDNSDLNQSLPYDRAQKASNPSHAVSQEAEPYKLRPISAAVIRSPNVKIKESTKEKRDFKISNLDEENNQDKEVVSFKKFEEGEIGTHIGKGQTQIK